MNTYRYLLALAGFVILLLFPLAARATGPPGVFISEIAWAGSSKSASDEWLELCNRTDTTVDVSGWMIEGAATSQGTLVLPAGSLVEPHATYLIANYAADNASSTLDAEPNFVTTSVSLSNSALGLVLKDAAGAVVDRAGNGDRPFAGGVQTNAGAASMQRLDPLVSGDDPLAWRSAATSVGFDANAPDLGTPMTLDEDSAPVFEEQPPESGETDVPAEPDSTSPEDSAEESPVEEQLPPAEDDDQTNSPAEEPASEPPDVIETTSTDETNEPSTDTSEEPASNPPPSSEEPAETASATDTASDETSTTETDGTATVETIPDAEETPEPTPLVYPAGTLVINEFVSDPVKGEVEWVEILNPYNNVIPLEGWTVKESSGRAAALTSGLLGFGQFAVATYSSGALNNDGDAIRLFDPSGNLIDEVVYGTDSVPASGDPASVARRPDGTFAATKTPTRGEANILTTTEVAEDETADDAADETEDATTATETAACTESTTTAASTTTSHMDGTPTSAATASPPGPTTLRFSELYPNTTGSDAEDEFIEIVNVGETAAALLGWSVEDASGRRHTSKDPAPIAPQGMAVLKRATTNISLNNSGSETLRLFAPDGSLVDEVTYENAPEGLSYGRFDAVWRWTSDLTPDEPNEFSEPQMEVGSESGTGSAVAQPVDYGLAALRGLAAGTRVRVSGIVTATPGTLGSQIMYLASADGQASSGVQIYKSDADFPELSLGDEVTLTGTTSTNRGEQRVKVGKTDAIIFLSSQEQPAPSDAVQLGEELEGTLVKTSGHVLAKAKDRFTLETEGGDILVRAKPSADVDLSELVVGASVEATGIVGETDGQYALYLRQQDDVAVTALPQTEEEAFAAAVSAKTQRDASQANTGLVLALVTIAALAAFWIRHRLTHSSYEQPKLSVARPS